MMLPSLGISSGFFILFLWDMLFALHQLDWLKNYTTCMGFFESHPYGCESSSVDCSRGALEKGSTSYVYVFAVYPLFAVFFAILVTMPLMSWKVYHKRRVFRSRFGESSISTDQVFTVWSQASLYVLSFFSIYALLALIFFKMRGPMPPFVLRCINRFLFPLQGFWNFFVFIRLTTGRVRKQMSSLWLPAALWEAMKRESVNFRPRNTAARGKRNFNIVQEIRRNNPAGGGNGTEDATGESSGDMHNLAITPSTSHVAKWSELSADDSQSF